MKKLKFSLRFFCAALLVLSLSVGLFSPAFAVSSADIQDELDELEKKADAIKEQQDALQEKIDENDQKTLSFFDGLLRQYRNREECLDNPDRDRSEITK